MCVSVFERPAFSLSSTWMHQSEQRITVVQSRTNGAEGNSSGYINRQLLPNMTERSDVTIAQSAHISHVRIKRLFPVECHAETLDGRRMLDGNAQRESCGQRADHCGTSFSSS